MDTNKAINQVTKRVVATLTVAFMFASMFALASVSNASATKPNPEHKVWVCHATSGLGELKNGYNLIHVDVASTQAPKGDHWQHSTYKPKKNSKFGWLWDYIDVDPDNLPGKCAPPPPPSTTTTEAPTTTVQETTTTVAETTTTEAPTTTVQETTTTVGETTTTEAPTTTIQETTTTIINETTIPETTVTEPPVTTTMNPCSYFPDGECPPPITTTTEEPPLPPKCQEDYCIEPPVKTTKKPAKVVPPVVTTQPPAPPAPESLAYTGINTAAAIVWALGLIVLGLVLVFYRKAWWFTSRS